jgi:hypothetical protein
MVLPAPDETAISALPLDRCALPTQRQYEAQLPAL